VTPTIVIYKVYRKIKSIRGEEKALEAYAQMSLTRIVDLTSSLSLEAADISINLNFGMADSVIVATAKAYNAQIVTSDEHLKKLTESNSSTSKVSGFLLQTDAYLVWRNALA
jgi:predicted nucleic acid-binding protein